jgi:hypothetical protein
MQSVTASVLFDLVGNEILDDECDADVRGNS